ncbi:hypothetical protein LZZ85_01325 [Terrimonas sp. NA20]|uniref:Uncharacterized protein n=1 Tax=Terrimonas ginsenosidimutans TaxID=2908004 RepID=A0ABS9KKP2_9BACT|nr:hypothetical protein [Terrimonas ginsenosidimutans]MCG2612892.1 hypothetical protein [Terrimonas ginsenosidimutans]
MAARSTPDKRYYLNRLALEHECDPQSLDPYWVLQQLFSDVPLEEMQELFSDFCEAAIAPAYIWKSKTPGALVRFVEELEQLIEGCFILMAWFKTTKGPISRTDESPAQVVRQFFKAKPLAVWKSWLHSWQTGALSACSVAEIVEPEDLLPFVQWMEKLFPAAAALAAGGKKSK